jgi:hypothetical protein
VPPFDDVSVGTTIQVGNKQVFITQKGEANIVGGEGQLAFNILPGDEVRYLDGNSGEEQISLEYTSDEIEMLVGRAVPHDALDIEEEDW